MPRRSTTGDELMSFPTSFFDFQLAKGDDQWKFNSMKPYGYELKYDGERAMLLIGNGEAEIWNRRKRNKGVQYPELVSVGNLPTGTLLDGEICVMNGEGRSDFDLLATRSHLTDARKIADRRVSMPVRFVIFDIPYYNNQSMMNKPYCERRALLEHIVPMLPIGYEIAHCWTDYNEAWQFVLDHGEEGLIAKRYKSVYSPKARNNDWVKIKAFKEAEAVVKSFEINNAGITLTCIDTEIGREHRVQCADKEAVAMIQKSLSDNEIVVEVQYLSRTQAGAFRFPSFRGILRIGSQDMAQAQGRGLEAWI